MTIHAGHQATAEHHPIAHVQAVFPGAFSETDGVEHRATLWRDDVRKRRDRSFLFQLNQLGTRLDGGENRMHWSSDGCGEWNNACNSACKTTTGVQSKRSHTRLTRNRITAELHR